MDQSFYSLTTQAFNVLTKEFYTRTLLATSSSRYYGVDYNFVPTRPKNDEKRKWCHEPPMKTKPSLEIFTAKTILLILLIFYSTRGTHTVCNTAGGNTTSTAHCSLLATAARNDKQVNASRRLS